MTDDMEQTIERMRSQAKHLRKMAEDCSVGQMIQLSAVGADRLGFMIEQGAMIIERLAQVEDGGPNQ